MESVFDLVSEGILIFHKSRGIIDCNKQACSILDLDKTGEENITTRFKQLKWSFQDGKTIPIEKHPVYQYYKNGNILQDQIMGVKIGKAQLWLSINITYLKKENPDIVIMSFSNITVLMRLNNALKESEEKYRNIYNHAEIGIGIYSVDGYMISLNKLALKQMQKTVNEIHGKKITDVFPKAYGKTFLSNLKKTANENKTIYYEEYIDNINLWLSFVFSPITDTKGHITSIQVLSKDISAEKEALLKIEESKNLYQTIFNLTPVGIITFSISGKITGTNKAFYELSGFSEKEIVGKTIFNIPVELKPEQYEIKNLLQKIIASEQLFHIRFKFTDKNGNERICLTNMAILKSGGEKTGIIATMSDITDQALLEQNLIEERNKAHEFIDMAGSMFVKLNRDGIIEYINPAACEILEYTQEELIGQNWFNTCLFKKNQAEVKEIFRKIINEETAKSVRIKENPVKTKSGKIKHIRWVNSVIFNEHKELDYIISSGTDITAEKKLHKKEHEYNLMLETILENSPDAILISKTPTSNFIYVNQAGCNMLGFQPEEIYLKKPENIFNTNSDFKRAQEIANKKQRNKPIVYIKGAKEKITPCELTAIFLPDKRFYLYLHDISFRKKNELKLHTTNAMLNNLIQNQGEGIAIVDIEEKFTFLNPAACKIFNESMNNLLGASLKDYVSKETFNLLKQQTGERKKGIENSYEFELIRKNGEKRTVLLTGTPNFNQKKELTGTFCVFRDITERKQAEYNLIRTKKILENLISNLPGLVYRCNDDETYTMTFLSGSCEKITGYTPDEMLFNHKISYWDIIHPDDRNMVRSSINVSVKNERPYNLTYRIVKKDGTIRWVWEKGKKVSSVSGKRKMLEGYIEDVTITKEIERSLIESENKFRKFTDMLPLAVFEINLNGNFNFINEYGYKMFGYAKHEFIKKGNNIKLFFPPDEYNKALRSIQKTIQEEKPTRNEYLCRKGDGSSVPVIIYSIPIKKNGKPFVIRSIMTDITEQKEKEQKIQTLLNELEMAKKQAEKANKLKSEFLSNISHEMRTPLNSIIGFAELLKSQKLKTKERDSFIEIINNSGQQLASIITDIANISKIEENQLDIHKETFNLIEKLKEFEIFFQNDPLLKQKDRVLLHFNHPSEQNISVFTDKSRLQQVLSNLIRNAIKFTNKGKITVHYKKINQNEIKFIVEDTGIGIKSDNHDKIFDRFFQVNNSNSENNIGTGLGLAISKSIIELLGGKIWLESKINKGTRFYFTIPLGIKDNIHMKKEKDESVSNNDQWKGKTILFVEDDESSVEYYKVIMSHTPADVVFAYTGEQAVDIVRKNKNIRLVLMDINLLKINGYEALNKIREFNKTIPVIAQTAFALTHEKERVLKSGFNDFITKPVKRSDLLNMISKYISKNN